MPYKDSDDRLVQELDFEDYVLYSYPDEYDWIYLDEFFQDIEQPLAVIDGVAYYG